MKSLGVAVLLSSVLGTLVMASPGRVSPGARKRPAQRPAPARSDARPKRRRSPLVDLQAVIPSLRVELRYASTKNFLGRRLYPRGARALARPRVARRLVRVQRHLRKRGLGLLIWDAYRPRAVQWALWRAMPDRRYVADPRRGSDHNRGAALDLTLIDLATGDRLEMPTDHDVVGPKAHRGARRSVSRAAQKNAALLDREMRRAGFVPLRTEWWHFSAPEARRYGILDEPLVRRHAPRFGQGRQRPSCCVSR